MVHVHLQQLQSSIGIVVILDETRPIISNMVDQYHLLF